MWTSWTGGQKRKLAMCCSLACLSFLTKFEYQVIEIEQHQNYILKLSLKFSHSPILQLRTFPGRPWHNKNVKSPNYAKMTNYSRFPTSNCRRHSHTMLPKGKSGTVSDNKDIEPLVTYLGETKVNFESDDLLSLAVIIP